MKAKAWGAAALALTASVALVTPASAAERATSQVSIRAESGGFFGYLKSSDPAMCAEGRKVTLFKQRGDVQNPQTDRKIASDTASLNGDRYMWSTGNTGSRNGKFYARVGKNMNCKADTSPTINALP